MWEATVAGTAAGLLATGRVRRRGHLPGQGAAGRGRRRVEEIALVDVCVSTVAHVGSKALWQPDTLREVYCAFAEPHAIGLSSIAGLLHPTGRTDPDGVAVRLAPPLHAPLTVLAPIAPGVVVPIGVRDAGPLQPGDAAHGRGRARHRRRRRRARDRVRPATPVTVTLAPTDPGSSTCAACWPRPPTATAARSRAELDPMKRVR